MIRDATPADAHEIAQLIRELAEYEKLTHEIALDADRMREHLFGARPYAEVILSEHEGAVTGMAFFFMSYSTFQSKPGLYLEDLFVRPEYRGLGHGKGLLVRLAQLAVERDCARMEWRVLDWNEPSIRFYESLGAVALPDWTTYRLAGEALARLGGSG
jgi:GNAT superfamily N-acetyltransferase